MEGYEEPVKDCTEIRAHLREYRHLRGTSPFLQDISLKIGGGYITSLLGPSGAGKTTLMRILMSASSGRPIGKFEYQVSDRRLSPDQARHEGLVGYLFQGHSLLPWSTVRENLFLPSQLNPNVPRPTEAQMITCLISLNLQTSCLALKPHELSFGMQQRIAFARVLLYRPRFLFLDEMFAGLDSANAEDLGVSLNEYVKNSIACCLLVSHDVDLSTRLSKAFLYLSPGGRLTDLGKHATSNDVLTKMREDVQQKREVSK